MNLCINSIGGSGTVHGGGLLKYRDGARLRPIWGRIDGILYNIDDTP